MATADATLSLSPEAGLEDRQETILKSFQGNIQPVTSPASYRLGIGLVAVVMVLLPLIYLAIIGLVCWAVYYHAVNHTGIMGSVRGRGAIFTVLLYFAPMVIGGILILFMFKPLFSRPPQRPRTRTLKREGEPLLFAFVDRICDAVGSSRPREIMVDCEVNASASFRRGLLSMAGNDLVLTVGLPLVAGLNLREFGGVLAHEFGHFAQGAGMRLTYVIRSISFWFTRVVYERDAWDQQLHDWARETDIRIGWVLYLAQFFVWVTRGILWVLMMAGHAVSGFMLRQMEFDADRHEARLAGSDTFESTARRLVLLNFANHGAQQDLGRFYQEGRLADDLPRLIMANVEQMPPEAAAAVEEVVEKSTTGWLDTHPCDRDRIASAHHENAAGVFRLDQPAALLFRDFAETARGVTLDFYINIFGETFRRETIHPVEDLLARQGKEIESYKALGRYFQRTFSAWRPVRLARWHVAPAAEPEQAADRLRHARETLLADLPKYHEISKWFDEGDTWLLQAEQGRALLDANLRAAKADFPMPLSSWHQVSELQRSGAERLDEAESDLAAWETRAAERLLTALDLLATPAAAERLPDSEERRQECATLFRALAALEDQVGAVTQLRNTYASLGILLGKIQGNEVSEAHGAAIRAKMTQLNRQLAGVYDPLSHLPYPFDHATKDITIAAYAVATLPHEEDLGGLMNAGESVLNTLPQLRARLLGRLCQIAEEVEASLGLDPLPELPKEEEKKA